METPDLPSIFFYVLVNGSFSTLLLCAQGLLGGFVLGLSLAIMRVYGGRELGWLASAYEKVLRGIPLLVLMSIFVFGMPDIFWFIDPLTRPLFGVTLALALRSGAYQSQLFRGAILSVNPGQIMAARAIGMNQFQAFRHIVLPQALRLAVPSWSNEYAVVIKDSSYAYGFGIIEILKVGFRVSANYPMLWAPTMGVVAIIYFIFTYPITKMFGERQTKKLKKLGMGGG